MPESFSGRLRSVVTLSVPAILAQMSSIAMQYIDAAMVGSLGADASAAIGLVSSSAWLMSGLCTAAATGFSVQVAHLIGAGREADARGVVRQGLVSVMLFALLLAAAGALASRRLPFWLGGDAAIRPGAGSYFLIYALAVPAVELRLISGSMLQCSGSMKIPSLFNALMCLFDVVFNSLLIFPTRMTALGFTMPGAGMGVAGAALGTALAELCTAALMFRAMAFKSPALRLTLERGSWRPTRRCLANAARIALPMALENTVLNSAQIVSTRIVSSLHSNAAIAAHSLAVTSESLCYMPGFGISTAATTLVGQSLGAGRPDQAAGCARISVGLAVALMSAMGLAMYLFAPALFSILTPDPAVRELGARVLRIECFAEPLYAVSIAATGALRGAGDTLWPSVMNLVSMWGVRIPAAAILSRSLGLAGVWLAMACELGLRGLLFLIRLLRGRWLKTGIRV